MNGEEEEKSPFERNTTPAPMIEKAEEVRQISQVDDCKAPIIDNSSSESEEEEGGAVKVRLNQSMSNTNIYWLKVWQMIIRNQFTIFFCQGNPRT